MVDLVYILSDESRWLDNEIKYSLRSAEKYLKRFRKVFIIGQKPLFFNDLVIEIPFKDIYGNKARNIQSKISRAAGDYRITNNFILFNDDYFLLKDADAMEYPFYFKNTLPQALDANAGNYEYHSHIRYTMNALSFFDLPMLNFDSHYPILYNKAKVKKVVNKYIWNNPFGLIFKSTYCNTLGIVGEFKEDCKINHPHVYDNWKNVTKGLDMFSIGDRCLNKSMEQYLFHLFPKKSKYEV